MRHLIELQKIMETKGLDDKIYYYMLDALSEKLNDIENEGRDASLARDGLNHFRYQFSKLMDTRKGSK